MYIVDRKPILVNYFGIQGILLKFYEMSKKVYSVWKVSILLSKVNWKIKTELINFEIQTVSTKQAWNGSLG